MAAGSLRELETYTLLAQRVGLAAPVTTQPILDWIHVLSKQMVNLQRSLRRS
nr:hypothetical protein [Chloracidobacterium aggregatum]